MRLFISCIYPLADILVQLASRRLERCVYLYRVHVTIYPLRYLKHIPPLAISGSPQYSYVGPIQAACHPWSYSAIYAFLRHLSNTRRSCTWHSISQQQAAGAVRLFISRIYPLADILVLLIILVVVRPPPNTRCLRMWPSTDQQQVAGTVCVYMFVCLYVYILYIYIHTHTCVYLYRIHVPIYTLRYLKHIPPPLAISG